MKESAPMSRPSLEAAPARHRRITRRDALLVAAGLLAWVAMAFGAVWLTHAIAKRSHPGCGTPCDAPDKSAAGARGPAGVRDSLGALGGDACRCE